MAWPLAAQDKMGSKKPLEASDTQSITATVEAVDSATREITLKGPKGNVVVMEVPESVKRFSEIKVGDQLHIKYTESLVVALRKADAAAKLGTTTDTGMTRMEGAKPGAVVSRQITATVEVVSVDKAASCGDRTPRRQFDGLFPRRRIRRTSKASTRETGSSSRTTKRSRCR